jgi:hypothetical protein
VGGGTLAAGLALVPTAHAKAPNVDWDGLRKDIEAIIEAEDKRRGDGTGAFGLVWIVWEVLIGFEAPGWVGC